MTTTEKSRYADSSYYKAFTLIELLVVIGVTTILIILGFSAVKTAQGKALTAKCAGNLKNIGAGLNMYIVDNKYYPGAVPSPGTFWIQVVEEYATGGAQQGLSSLSNMVKCPARAPGTGTFGIGYAYNYAGFGFSEDSVGGAVLPPEQRPPQAWHITPARITQPSKAIVIGDGLDEPTPGTYAELYLYLSNFAVLAKRHVSAGNYLFADGHIEWLTPAAIEKLYKDQDNGLPIYPL